MESLFNLYIGAAGTETEDENDLGPYFRVISFEGREKISQMYSLKVVVEVTEFGELKELINRLLKERVFLEVNYGTAYRTFPGVVRKVSIIGRFQNSLHLELTIVPRIWFLKEIIRSEIFMDMTIPEIITQVLSKDTVIYGDISIDVSGINPENYDKSEELAEKLAEIRKSKGMTIEEARKLVKNPLYLGCMIIKTEGADGQISGALSTTGDTLRPALQIIKCQPGITCVSGGLLLISKQKQYGEDGVLVIADVAVTPMPDANQLAQIAVCTAQMAKAVAGFEDPRVAMLSFSTKGSAKHEVCDKVIEATKLAKEMAPDLKIDGELQADAALVPSVGAKKAPGSDIAGKANVLVFPNLEVGNIGYKMVQRLGDAIAIGPILQGIARPVNDLSRGCSIDDIYYMIAITACQAMDAKK